MDILDRIFKLLRLRYKQQKDLAEFLGISPNTITDWKSGRNKSYKKYLYQIAVFLETSPEYLRGESDNADIKNQPIVFDLDDNEALIISKYRRTTTEGKARITQSVLNICDEIEKNN